MCCRWRRSRIANIDCHEGGEGVYIKICPRDEEIGEFSGITHKFQQGR